MLQKMRARRPSWNNFELGGGNEEDLGRWPSEERAPFQTKMHILSHETWGEMGDSEHK